jgi:hypothetical protein
MNLGCIINVAEFARWIMMLDSVVREHYAEEQSKDKSG